MGSTDNNVQPATGLLSLPVENRISIYKEVFGAGHTFHLFQGKGSQVEAFAPGKPRRWSALLLTNHQICNEAREIVYGANHFILVDTTEKQAGLLHNFLNGIGPVNASFITHLAINFPVLERVEGQAGELSFREDSQRTLTLLQEQCTNLKTLETQIHRQNSSGLAREKANDSQFAQEALPRIDQQLRVVASLEKIIVEVDGKPLLPPVKSSMRGLGWVVK